MLVREAINARDAEPIWAILEPVIRAGETYPLPRDMDRESAVAYWFSPGHEVFVAEDHSEIVGTYFLQTNQRGGGAHVANCGYMTAPDATGRGVARAMCASGFEIVGRLPKAFEHPTIGFVDAYIMYRQL